LAIRNHITVGAARSVLVALLCGAAVGVVVGGLGGRVSMRLVAVLTDGPGFTLTGAEVGEVTLGGTLSLLGSAAQVGVIGGALYAVLRSVLPSAQRASVFALLALLLPGGLLLGDEEFKLFDPSLLTAALFIPLFPAFGFALSAAVERLDPRSPGEWTRNRRLVVAFVALLGLAVLLRNVAKLS